MVDLKDSRIMVLTTKVEALEEKVAKSANATSGYTQPRSGDGNSNTVEKIKGMPKWRMIKKEASVTQNGVTWHWYKHHKGPEGAWNRLYARHKDKVHNLQMARFKSRHSKFKKNDGDKGSGGSGNKLVLGQRLKEVLCSQLMFDDKDAEQYCQDIIQGKY